MTSIEESPEHFFLLLLESEQRSNITMQSVLPLPSFDIRRSLGYLHYPTQIRLDRILSAHSMKIH